MAASRFSAIITRPRSTRSTGRSKGRSGVGPARDALTYSALGAKSPGDLIALAKKDPHKIIIGTNPAGTLPHLAAQLLVDLSQAPMTVVPYSSGGTNGAISDIMGGRVHVVIESRSGLKGARFW